MSEVFFDVQQAVFDALNADAGVQAVLGSPPRLYDHVPPGAVHPYAALGSMHAAPDDSKADDGFEIILGFEILSRYRGSKEAQAIVHALYNALHRAALTASGFVITGCAFHSVTFEPDGDGQTTRGSARFRLFVHAG